MRLVGKVEQAEQNCSAQKVVSRNEPEPTRLEKRLEDLTKNVDSMQKSLQGLMQKQNFQRRSAFNKLSANAQK